MVVFVIDTQFTNGGHGYDFDSSVGHPKLNSIELLVYDDMCTISKALVLYYRPSGSLQLYKKGVNILSRL
jgi:hypothetical protein